MWLELQCPSSVFFFPSLTRVRHGVLVSLPAIPELFRLYWRKFRFSAGKSESVEKKKKKEKKPCCCLPPQIWSLTQRRSQSSLIFLFSLTLLLLLQRCFVLFLFLLHLLLFLFFKSSLYPPFSCFIRPYPMRVE